MKKKESEYKKYYTFKHNCILEEDTKVWVNPKPVETSHISDSEFENVKTEILNRIHSY